MNVSDLRRLPALSDFTEKDLEVLLSACPQHTYAPGQLLCAEGAPGASCFLVVHGEVEAVKGADTAGKGGRVLNVLRAGALIGQLALVDRSPRSATVRAREATEALEIPRDVFERLLKALSPMALAFQRQVCIAGIRQLRTVTNRLRQILGVATAAPVPATAATSRVGRKPGKADDEMIRNALLEHVQTAAGEWSISIESLDGLDDVEVVEQAGDAPRGRPRR